MTNFKGIDLPESRDQEDIIKEALQRIGNRRKDFNKYGVSRKVYIEKIAVPCDVDDKTLATYADVVTTVFPDAVMMSNPLEPSDYNLNIVLALNLTAWGNMAYIAEHATRAVNRTKAKIFLSVWRTLTKEIIRGVNMNILEIKE